ncbi:MAG: hypothetical protein AB7F59_03920 [Bdellovibrionales bacterium]
MKKLFTLFVVLFSAMTSYAQRLSDEELNRRVPKSIANFSILDSAIREFSQGKENVGRYLTLVSGAMGSEKTGQTIFTEKNIVDTYNKVKDDSRTLQNLYLILINYTELLKTGKLAGRVTLRDATVEVIAFQHYKNMGDLGVVEPGVDARIKNEARVEAAPIANQLLQDLFVAETTAPQKPTMQKGGR